ncbi:MAG: hypothetical protein MZW92_07025 [Comamonadaceae bacterium]|nr:hypothetical protein [Comamonadaceae bacterium]
MKTLEPYHPTDVEPTTDLLRQKQVQDIKMRQLIEVSIKRPHVSKLAFPDIDR